MSAVVFIYRLCLFLWTAENLMIPPFDIPFMLSGYIVVSFSLLPPFHNVFSSLLFPYCVDSFSVLKPHYFMLHLPMQHHSVFSHPPILHCLLIFSPHTALFYLLSTSPHTVLFHLLASTQTALFHLLFCAQTALFLFLSSPHTALFHLLSPYCIVSSSLISCLHLFVKHRPLFLDICM